MSVVSLLSDQEALERFKESQPELRSVAQIARLTEEHFVQTYGDGEFFAGDMRQARRVYWTAKNVDARNALIWANIKDAVASPYYRATLFNNIPQEFIQHLENLPGYQRLFGNLDFVECDHCRSIFGPAAYFVDLVRFVQDFAANGKNEKDKAFPINGNDPARRRRPDLFTFPLDCANTHELIPYIDLVNEVLEAVIRSPEQPDAMRVLDETSFPWAVPFSRPLAEIREYLSQLGANLSAIYAAYLRRQLTGSETAAIETSVDPAVLDGALAAAQAAKDAAVTRHVDREYLQLSPAEYALVTSEATQPEEIEALYGTAYELTASSLQGIKTAAGAPLSDDAVKELGALAGRSIRERSEFVTRLTKLTIGLRKASKAVLAGEIEANLDAIVAGAFNRYDLQRLAELPTFLEQTGLDRKQVNELIYQDLDRHELSAGLARLFFINNVDDGLGPLLLVDGPSGPRGFDERLVNLSYAKLDRIHRFVRLARKLGWPFTDLDMALRSLVEPFEPASVLTLDGIDDYVACRNVTGLDLTDFTVETWVNPSRHGANVIVAKGHEPDWHFVFLIKPDGRLAFYDQQSQQFISGVSQVPTGVWSHVAVTVSGTDLRFYLDGQPDGPFDEKGNEKKLGKVVSPLGADLDIGRNLIDAYFAGQITEVRIWQGAASQAAIAGGRYRRLTGREPGLSGYWPLTENPYDQLFDLTPNRNDGVMGGEEFVTQPVWVQRDLVLEPAPDPVSAKAYRFDGVDQYLAARKVRGSDMNALTLETWVKWEQRPTAGDQEIIAKGQESTGQAQFRLWIDDGGHLNFKSTSLPKEYKSRQTLTPGRWTHVAVTLPESAFDGPTFRWFADDTAVAAFKAGALSKFVSTRHDAVIAVILTELGRKAQRSAVPGVSAADFVDVLAQAIGAEVLATPTSGAGATAETPIAFIEQALKDSSPVKLSPDNMDALVSPRVPADVYGWIEQLQADQDGKEFANYEALVTALWRTIGAELLAPYQANALQAAEVRCLRITIDGKPEEFEIGQGPVVLAATGDTISVGRRLRGPRYRYFQGRLKELRVWRVVRTAEQLALGSVRAVGTREPGLAGYWRFDDVQDGQAWDLSSLGNHLFLGGILADYAPKRVATDYFLPPLPVAVAGKALQFDGQSNLVAVQDPKNGSLGAYDRMTLALWFNAADAAATDREQILYTQGDAEDGLTIYLHGGVLTVAAWANTFEGDALQTVMLKTAAGQIDSGKWQHVAVVKDEEAAPDAANSVPQKLVRYTAYLDGAPFGQADATFRLSPVGPSFLGGLGKDAVTWSETLGTHSSTLAGQTAGPMVPHFFAGMLADLRVWRTAKTEAELAVERFVAPVLPDPDLILYLPLTETTGPTLEDRSDNNVVATFLARNMVLAAQQVPAELDEVHAHYADPAALQWTNYAYTGRLRVSAADGAVGLTFFSRYPEQIDRYYAIKRNKGQPTFVLASHPAAVQTLQGATDSQVTPQANDWHRFRIEVEAQADRTRIRAKIWPETAAEPADFQIDAFDASSVRAQAGTVGIWTQGDGQAAFDQIEVRPLAGGSALRVEHFERLADGQAPPTWQQTGTRRHHQGSNTFRTIAVDGNTTYGTDLPEGGNLSLVSKRGAQGWTDYTVRGDLLVTEDDSGVGVLFLAQGPDRYYKLGRNKESRSFSLTAWPAGLQTLAGNADTGVVPAANAWVSFKIKTETTASATRILAKVWQSDDDEPPAYQVDASDASEIRLRAGTIGVWASGPGIKCVDSLIVSTIERQGGKQLYSVLHSESFRSVRRGSQPAGWQDSGAVYRFQPLTGAFTGSEAQAGAPQWPAVANYPLLLKPLNRKALEFDGSLTYAAAEKVTSLDATQFTVEAWIKPAGVQAGPILSQQVEPGAAPSLQLGLNAQGQLALSYARQDGALETIAGATPLNAAEWSHVVATVDGRSVLLYVNGQQDGAVTAAEPATLGGASLELGRGGDLAASAPALQVFDGQIRDLRVWRGVRGEEQIAGGRFQQPELSDDLIGYWPFDEDTGDTTADESPAKRNALRLGGLESARRPLLHDPSPVFALPALADPAQDAGLFDPAALKLDGVDDYVEIALTPAVTADAATWEAWVRLDDLDGEATLWEQQDQRVRLTWRGNRLAIFVAGNETQTQTFDFGFDLHAWTHVAVVYSSADKRVDLFINGNLVGQSAYGSAAALALSDARMGLSQTGSAGLRGLVKELRLWSVARSETDIEAIMFRRLTGTEPNLLVYRPFDEQGSLDHAPAWVSPDLLADSLGQGFFRPQRQAVSFDGQAEGLVHWTSTTAAPATGAAPCQRRTVEVWFKADDVRISRRKQVIYHEGNDQQGLVLYLFDGRLYYGGYSLLADAKAWASWTGTWLSTERVSSGKWHHAAIVLDGRDEVRDGSFQAYLDGKLVDDGLGAQLATCSRSIALGRAGGKILFHDGEVVDAPAPAPLPAPTPAPVLPPLTPADLDKSTIPLGQPQQPFPFPSQAFTVECWINPALSRYQGSPISYAVSKDNDNTFVLYLYHHSELTVVINEQRISASGVTTLAPNRWQHVAVTWQASDGQIDVYKDGQEVYSGQVSAGQPVAGGGSLVFGQEQDRPGGDFDPNEAFDGKLSEVRIWDHVRTAEQVRDGMKQRLADGESGLVARWPADPTATSSPTPAPAAGAAASSGKVGSVAAAGADQSTADAARPVDAARFAGQILDLRIWTTARTQRQLDVYRYRQLRSADAAGGLDLWWQFEGVVAGVIPDLSGKGHNGALTPPAAIEPIGAAPARAMPRSRLDEDGLGRLANLKRLLERYNLPVERLTALWHEIRHTGLEDGRTLWDETFNPKGGVFEPWPFHIDQPLRWDVSGATEQELSRQIRSRLMGALRVSHDQLNQLVATLSGEGETMIELDGQYLTNLYRLARLPGLLRLNVAEFQRLLALMGRDKVDSLPALVDVSERVDWMQRTGIDVFELDFLANDRESERVKFPYNDAAVRDLADSLRRQSGELLAQSNTFVSAEIGELQSAGLFKLLGPGNLGILNGNGAVRPDYEPPAQFERLFYLAPAGDAGDTTKLELNLTQAAYARLTQGQLEQLRSNSLIDDNGLVLDKQREILLDPAAEFKDTLLQPIFSSANADTLALIREGLERGLKIQTDLAGKLLRLRDNLAYATLAGITDLMGATPDRTLAVLQHLGRPAAAPVTAQPAADLSEKERKAQQQLAARTILKQLFDILFTIQDDQQSIPPSLTGRPGGYFYQLSKILFLAGQFGLTVDEISALVENPARFDVDHILRPSLADLTNLYLFASLKLAFGDAEGKLISLLSTDGSKVADVAAAIHRLTGWEERQIRSLMAAFEPELVANRVGGLERLRAMFELAETLHVDVEFFTTQLARTADLSYDFYAHVAANLLEIVRSHYDDEQWTRVARPIHDRLAVQTRDALLGRAMLAISPEFAGRRSPDVLSEYLLLDMQTGSEVDTSRLVQATAALQLYVQRCMMNLERGIDPASIPAKQWEWMKNYRVWEANRKVFLYPENYIEPELRDTKTPFFEELEQDLMQGEINQDLVEKAYVRYLDKFAEVANLKIVGSYLHVEPANEETGKTGKQVLYLIGCTRTEPRVHYLREFVDDKRWTPWQKIGISIAADSVTPVYAFKRLFLFWPEFTKVTESRDVKADATTPQEMNDNGYKLKINVGGTKIREQENVDVFKATIRYTYQNMAGEWVQPQVYMELGRDLEKYEVIRPEWRRVYAQQSATISLTDFFSIKVNSAEELDKAALPKELGPAASQALPSLADSSKVTVLETGRRWRIEDPNSKKVYTVVKERPDSEMLNVYPTNELTEDSPQVLQIEKAASISEDIAAMSMKDLTWEFWVHVAKTSPTEWPDPEPDPQEPGQTPDRQKLAQKLVQPVVLVEYGAALLRDPRLRLTISSNVTPIPGAPDVEALKKTLETAKLAATEADNRKKDKQSALDKLKEAKPQDQGKIDETNDELRKANVALGKANASVATAQTRVENAKKELQWQSLDLTFAVQFRGAFDFQDAATIKVDYGSWQHLAITMRYDDATRQYEVTLIKSFADDAKAPITVSETSPAVDVLPERRELALGIQAFSDKEAKYTVQMSEFRLWDKPRDPQTILRDRKERKGQDQVDPSLFVLPLNSSKLGGQVVTAAAPLPFRAYSAPVQPEERERILLFWGREVQRSVRNTLQDDQDFTLALRKMDEDRVPSSYSVELAESKLYAPAKKQLSLNDYAPGAQMTVSRFSPDIRLLITSADKSGFRLDQSQVALIRPLLGNLSAFGKVSDVQLDEPKSLEKFLKKTLRIEIDGIPDANDISDRNLLLAKMSSLNTSIADVGNQPGWYILDTTDEQFLVRITPKDKTKRLRTTAERLRFYYPEDAWRGEYYSSQDLTGTPVLVRSDPTIDFEQGAPEPGKIDINPLSVRWTRDQQFLAGTYKFMATLKNGGIRLYVDDELVINNWTVETDRPVSSDPLPLNQGSHRLRLEFHKNQGEAKARLGQTRLYDQNPWHGKYYNSQDLSGAPVLERSDSAIDFKWEGRSPGSGVNADNFSVRWTSEQQFDAGTYTFTAQADDGFRLYVDGTIAIDNWGSLKEKSVDLQMEAGSHDLRFESHEMGGNASANLNWQTKQPGKAKSQPAPADGQIASPGTGLMNKSLNMYFEPDPALVTTDEHDKPRDHSSFEFRFERLSTYVVHELSLRLFAEGIDGMLSLEAQEESGMDFANTYQPKPLVVPPGYDRATGMVRSGIDFDGPYGMYFREIFFHIPFFIANQLNTNQNFADAQHWYHYIFNPTIVEQKNPNPADNPNDRYWQFKPFRKLSLETLRQMLTNDGALEEYRQDPFDPHAIARLRINAYQKAIVMKYVDNLLDWGDNLFSQDTRESINEAAQLYLLAYNLLGARPKSKAVKDLREIGTLQDVLDNQAVPSELPDFVVALDRRLPAPALAGPAPLTPNNAIVTDFCVVENEQFMGYWDRVEDRLYKIRHSLNIEGTFRQLALFQPPINPMDLVRAIAGGRDLGSVLSDLNVPVPHYRYTYMWDRAKDIASTVSGLGSALLDALEKRDAEALSILQNTHEKQILDLTTSIMEREIKVIDETIEALNISRESIQARHDRFDSLIANGLIAGETAWLVLKGIALGLNVTAGGIKLTQWIVSALPSIEAGAAGFGGSPVASVEYGGDEAEGIPGAIAEGLETIAEYLDGGADIAEKVAEYERRTSEWKFELTIAKHELRENEKQLAIAQLQREIASQQLAIHKKTQQHNREIADFYRSKFGNQALYNWMVSRLAGLYFQAYKLAYDYAKSAEKALQFELPTTQSYISFGHWDSLKKGLLAGESLQLELDRMEKSHLNQDSRFQEIEKQISMQRSLPAALAELTRSGQADFQLGETLFNRDFPGHYARMIKTIGISIKTSSEVSPYDALYATLIQLGNKTLLEPNIGAVSYLMGVDGAEQPDMSVLRTNWRANQQVAISRIDDEEGDDGMFALDFFFDNRYFPFEGTGAVSAWRLEIAKAPEGFDLSSITDVVIHLRYTAKYDSGAFRQAVIKAMSNP